MGHGAGNEKLLNSEEKRTEEWVLGLDTKLKKGCFTPVEGHFAASSEIWDPLSA